MQPSREPFTARVSRNTSHTWSEDGEHHADTGACVSRAGSVRGKGSNGAPDAPPAARIRTSRPRSRPSNARASLMPTGTKSARPPPGKRLSSRNFTGLQPTTGPSPSPCLPGRSPQAAAKHAFARGSSPNPPVRNPNALFPTIFDLQTSAGSRRSADGQIRLPRRLIRRARSPSAVRLPGGERSTRHTSSSGRHTILLDRTPIPLLDSQRRRHVRYLPACRHSRTWSRCTQRPQGTPGDRQRETCWDQ